MHSQIVESLNNTFGIKVGILEDLISDIAVSPDNQSYKRLMDLAANSFSVGSGSAKTISGSGFPGSGAEHPDPYSLFLATLYNPLVRHNEDLTGYIELKRVLNGLLWMNDYYLTLSEGLIMGNMQGSEREKETALAYLGVKSLGIRPEFKIKTGSVEGGDIIPAGDFLMIGCGCRTSIDGIMELISSADLNEEIVIVHEPVHPLMGSRDPMVSGHLDEFLNFPREGLAIGDPILLMSAQVEVLYRESSGYYRSENAGNLLEYLRSKSIDLIELNTLEQLCKASGFLCVYEGECIAEDLNEKAPLVMKKIRDLSAVNGGKYDAILNRAEHDFRQMRYEGSKMMDREFLSDYGVEFLYISGEGTGNEAGGVRRYVGIISRR